MLKAKSLKIRPQCAQGLYLDMIEPFYGNALSLPWNKFTNNLIYM